MSRIALFRSALFALALTGLTVALSGGAALAGGYGPYYGGYAQPCCGYVPPPPPVPCCAPAYYPAYQQPAFLPAPLPQPLPPPPLFGTEGPKYYSGVGAAPGAACYRQNVRVPDRFGGWTWGVKHGCDPN